MAASLKEVPKALPVWLAEHTRIGRPGVASRTESSDGHTVKYLLSLEDGQRVEVPLIYGENVRGFDC